MQQVFDIPKFMLEDASFRVFCKKLKENIDVLSRLEGQQGKTLAIEVEMNRIRPHSDPVALLNGRTALRALTFLLGEKDYRARVRVTDSLLFAIEKVCGGTPTIQLTNAMTSVFFVRFRNVESFTYLCSWIQNARRVRKIGMEDDRFIFSEAGPRHISGVLENHGDEEHGHVLLEYCSARNLPALAEGAFYDVLFSEYYIETLKKLPRDTEHRILNELSKEKVYMLSYKENRCLGHEVLALLIDKYNEEQPCDRWRDLILNIAGDPRLSPNSKRYRQWWAVLGEDRKRKVLRWLAKVEIDLYLKIIKESARQSGNADKIRMFESRKKFIEGLFEHDLIHGSRLFLGSRDASHVDLFNSRQKTEIRYARLVGDSSKSIIYLDLAQAHVLEGTHSCRIRVMRSVPNNVVNWSHASYSYYELTKEIDEKPSTFLSIVHGRMWQESVINALQELGVRARLSMVV